MPDLQLTLDVLFDDDAHGAGVTQLAWRPTSPATRRDQLAGFWNDGDGDAWWLFDAAGGKTLLARPESFGVAAAGDVKGIRWGAADGRCLVVVFEGRFRLFDAEERRLVALVGSETEVRGDDPRLAPDGRRLAFVRDHDLWVLDLERREEERLTHDGVPGTVFNGLTDWVYWEEIWGRNATGHWWNRDGTRLAYYHLDDSAVPVYPLVDTRPLHPRLEHQRYPKAGDPLPRVEVRVADLASGRTVRLQTHDAGSEVYLARVHWHPDGERLAVERLNRRQTRLEVVLCESGDGSGRLLATQEQPTWVNLADDFMFLKDGRFLWSTEETGWRQLYLYEADGTGRRRLTPDGWAVASLDAVNVNDGDFVYSAHATGGLGAAERHVFRGEIDGDVLRLTETPGWHTVSVSPRGSWVEEVSDAATPPRQTIRHLESEAKTDLPCREPKYDVARLPQWERLTIPGAGGVELPAQLLKPAGFDPERAYPVLMYHYGCPSSQVVEDRWVTGRPRYLWHRMMAERGYGVFSVDNEASAHFGKRGEDRAHRRFGELELAAQLAGVEYLKTLSWVDASRIGLWGWSGGGSHTLYCLFRRPGVWKAGVAGAPVTDWRYYDAIWMERYLGHPRANAEGYELSAPLAYAARLRDPLLVVHGTADDNVHPQNTFNLIDALVEAGVPFEVALYPNAGHGLQTFTKRGQRHVFARMMEFFDRHLDPVRVT